LIHSSFIATLCSQSLDDEEEQKLIEQKKTEKVKKIAAEMKSKRQREKVMKCDPIQMIPCRFV